MKSERLDRIREHPARYLIPWSMTIARPILGELARREAGKGNWSLSKKLYIAAAGTDFEGIPARFFHATSKAGGVADPTADGFLRAEAAATFAPQMPVTTSVITGAEIVNLALNAKIQKGRDKPFVPREAKVGSAVQAGGAITFFRGIENNSVGQRAVGKAVMLVGTGLRVYAYGKEYSRMKRDSKNFTKK